MALGVPLACYWRAIGVPLAAGAPQTWLRPCFFMGTFRPKCQHRPAMPIIDSESRGGIHWLTLNRPRVKNALSPELLESLIAHCAKLAADRSIKLVVLRGAEHAFSAGADLPAFMAALTGPDSRAAAELGLRACTSLLSLPQITVAAIEGSCVGGGLVLAANCDLRFATRDAKFKIPELELGIPLAWGALPRLIQLLGEGPALSLTLTCRGFSAEEASRMGFVEFCDSPEAMLSQLESIASRPQDALSVTKEQLSQLRSGSFDFGEEAERLLEALQDPETLAAAQRYLSRRGHA